MGLAPRLLRPIVNVPPQTEIQNGGGQTAAPRVLLVEDNASTALLFRTILRHEGFIVEHCLDGEAALRALTAKDFDAVVLDLMMPRVDGVQVLKRMRAIPAHMLTPVIVVTAAKLKLVEEEVVKLGAKSCLDKTQHAQLPGLVRRAISDRAALGPPKLRMTEEAAAPVEENKPAEKKRGLSRFFG